MDRTYILSLGPRTQAQAMINCLNASKRHGQLMNVQLDKPLTNPLQTGGSLVLHVTGTLSQLETFERVFKPHLATATVLATPL